ncbi:hypothetical protein D1115_03680 [Vibrio alfacsensis]|uniref:ABC transporter substrate-binding protein n=1 Tax=Vibrio alfacsensis TaxID=1074311 RepID=A0ABM6YS16_9VIBR|nr:hypothetical protein D1115_03680 [Vibrio alfacsensis]
MLETNQGIKIKQMNKLLILLLPIMMTFSALAKEAEQSKLIKIGVPADTHNPFWEYLSIGSI